MTHPRTLIRNRVKEIISVIGALDGRIFLSRSYPLQTAELPGAIIFTVQESSDQLYMNKPTLDRDLEVAIELYGRDTENPDTALDDLAELVEAEMDNHTIEAGLWINSWLDRTDMAFDESGAKANGACRLVYRVRYHTAPA